MWHVGSWFPNQELNLRLMQWKHGVLSTGLPGGGGGVVAKLCPTLETPWTVASQAPLSILE